MPSTLDSHDENLKNELVEIIAEFFQISSVRARCRIDEELANPGVHVARAWTVIQPTTPAEVTRFYIETDSYVYDLAADHCRSRRRRCWDIICNRLARQPAIRDVLLYGDGIGSDTLALARRGYRATYFDLPGVTASFARTRFHRAGVGHAVRMLDRESAIPPDSFDAVVCVEVLEHLSDPVAALRVIHRGLREGGIALITESFEAVGPEYPSHLPHNARLAGRTHELMEDLGFASTYYNVDPVNYPMEFTKLAPGWRSHWLKMRGRVSRIVESRLRRYVWTRR